jgi:hypothetical protein
MTSQQNRRNQIAVQKCLVRLAERDRMIAEAIRDTNRYPKYDAGNQKRVERRMAQEQALRAELAEMLAAK